jgi:hypothetical protein
LRAVPPTADIGGNDYTKRRTPALSSRVHAAIHFALILITSIATVRIKSTLSYRFFAGIFGAALVYAAAACAQGNSNGLLSGDLMPIADSKSTNHGNDCETRFAALVRDLDSVLASDPETITPVYEVFHKYFPVEKCKIEDVLAIARASRFFVRSWEGSEYYSVAFSSADVSSRPGFAVQISMAKKTGNLELPFAKVNGY